MFLQTWLADLQSPSAQTRHEAALILGTLDEAAALDNIAAQYRTESDAKVKATLAWAGKRLHAAHQSGYTTLDAIFRHFHIDDELHPPDDAAQQELMRKLQYQMEMDALRQQEAAAGRKVMTRMAGGALFGLPGLMMAALPESTSLEVRSLHQMNLPPRRTPPTRPADSDITMLLRRLAHETEWQKRARAASDLAVIINNPQAIPHLARAFVQDRSPQVREAAQSAAKLLYWNHVYWHMDQDGTLAAEIARRSGKPLDAAAPANAPADSPVDDWLFGGDEASQSQPLAQADAEPRRSMIHGEKRGASELPMPDDDLFTAEYVEKRKSPASAAAPKPRKKQNNNGLLLLGLVGFMIVLVVGGIVVIALEGARVVQEVVTNPELVSMVNALAATPEGYDTLPANRNRRGTIEPFQPVQSIAVVGEDDAWTFSADAGDEITLVTLIDEASLYPRLFLYGPDGNLLAARADEISVNLNMPLTLTLPQDGRYTVVVSAPLLDTVYELTLQFVPRLGG